MPADRPESIEKIVARFQKAADPKRRYEQLLWFAKKLDPLPEEYKTPDNKVPGCVSQVFVVADLIDGKVVYQADSDAQITKGLVALLIKALNGLTPDEIVTLTPDFIKDTQLDVSLTPSRANGFYNIFKTMQQKARGLHDGAAPGALLS
ncbi:MULTISPECIES: SufE family protein [Cyanophyceae]|uniref:Cysteine desufuration protein SufE n=2 Tax=Cyanophyceae TaxID=3028117 RepID=A0A1U7JB97_9CYAN|nr:MULTISPECIES: SufE family protein [Cyanophyceae]MBD2107811.1 SufE family protein [Nodosilinea sp. FACHB-13]MBD2114501.1 SufE family protein [Nodosilinea sp. FACHB-141]MBD2230156.1 SufE family protein [Phormidium tenue FACHB-1052]OKH51015.1 cysteine desufuration protein SufE [Phormidium tenue NIES-30]